VSLRIPSSVEVTNSSILESEVREYIALVYDKNFKLICLSALLKALNLTMKKAKFFSTEDCFYVFSNEQSNEDLMHF
jgi:hypothetical protein